MNIDIKKWLARGNKIDERIKSKREQITLWQGLSVTLVVSYMHGSAQTDYDSKVERYACKCVDMEDKIGHDLRELVNVKIEITELLRKIDNPLYGLILENRYILGKRWEEIADTLGYDACYLRHLHNAALSAAQKKFNIS